LGELWLWREEAIYLEMSYPALPGATAGDLYKRRLALASILPRGWKTYGCPLVRKHWAAMGTLQHARYILVYRRRIRHERRRIGIRPGKIDVSLK
jgi:hypothetical protein